MVEVMSVTAIIGVVASVAVGLSSRTSSGIQDNQNQQSVLDYIQRERHAHVTRGDDREFLVICPSTGTTCGTAGDRLLAFRIKLPEPLTTAPTATLLSSQSFSGSVSFAPQASLIVDAHARSLAVSGLPLAVNLRIAQRASTQSVLFREDGVVLPGFDAPGAITVAPRLNDIGARATPNPTPRGTPSGVQRARQAFLE